MEGEEPQGRMLVHPMTIPKNIEELLDASLRKARGSSIFAGIPEPATPCNEQSTKCFSTVTENMETVIWQGLLTEAYCVRPVSPKWLKTLEGLQSSALSFKEWTKAAVGMPVNSRSAATSICDMEKQKAVTVVRAKLQSISHLHQEVYNAALSENEKHTRAAQEYAQCLKEKADRISALTRTVDSMSCDMRPPPIIAKGLIRLYNGHLKRIDEISLDPNDPKFLSLQGWCDFIILFIKRQILLNVDLTGS